MALVPISNLRGRVSLAQGAGGISSTLHVLHLHEVGCQPYVAAEETGRRMRRLSQHSMKVTALDGRSWPLSNKSPHRR